MLLPNLKNNVCFITEQNPVKDLLPFAINYYSLKLEFFLFFFFLLILVLGKKKKRVHYVEFKKAHATGMSTCPQANSLANPKHQTLKSKFIGCFLQSTIY